VHKKYIPAYVVELESFYRLVLFNYLFSNGNRHLKNFSIQMTTSGDYKLAPAYDLIKTKIHLKEDTSMALTDGLFKIDCATKSFEANAFYSYDDFYEFGLKIGLLEKRIIRMIDFFRTEQNKTVGLIEQSFLIAATKEQFKFCPRIN
jgi:serine/threonine-protein kinase HipA